MDRGAGREPAGADSVDVGRERRDRAPRGVPDVQEPRIVKRAQKGGKETGTEEEGADGADEDRAIFSIFKKRDATNRAGEEGGRKRTATSRAGEKGVRKRTATKRAGGGGAGKKEKAREEDRKGGGEPAAPREEGDRTDKGSETPRHDPG